VTIVLKYSSDFYRYIQKPLKLELEQVYLAMDTAVPLGIVVTELVSNVLNSKLNYSHRKKGKKR
jgi:two-component sensor histidine kinase